MSESDWAGLDRRLAGLLAPEDGALEAARSAGLPPHEVSPLQGKLLHLLARAVRAERILELGTLGGYSTIWLARALPPGGTLVTLEADPGHAAAARAALERAGLAAAVEIRAGPALETLRGLAGPFDLVFMDADKDESDAYLEAVLGLARPGTLVVADNVVRNRELGGVRRLFDLLAADPRVDATAVQTVGAKGWDGFALALVT